LVKPQGHLVWYVLALAVVPVLLALSMGITNLLGGELPPPRVVADGGRGDLQALYSPLTANLILAFFWALWHLPLPQAQGLGNPPDFLVYYVGTFAHCILIAWLFNQTGGSILVAGILHVSSNVSRLLIPETLAFQFTRPAFCLLLIVMYRMWERLPASRRDSEDPEVSAAEEGVRHEGDEGDGEDDSHDPPVSSGKGHVRRRLACQDSDGASPF
jgi:hypothetical protein